MNYKKTGIILMIVGAAIIVLGTVLLPIVLYSVGAIGVVGGSVGIIGGAGLPTLMMLLGTWWRVAFVPVVLGVAFIAVGIVVLILHAQYNKKQ